MPKMDDNLKKTLLQHTEDHQNMKEEIWNQLDQELFDQKNLQQRKAKTMKKRIFSVLVAAAAGLLIVFGFQTEPGMALMDRIKEMFEPEKEVTQQIEGTAEKTEVQLNEGKNSDYVIYIDEDRYKMVKGHGDEPDVIVPKEPLPEHFPEVSMMIEQMPDADPDELVKKVEEELKAEFPDLQEIEKVAEPVDGYQLHGIASGETQWDSPVVHAYVISNGQSGSFVITERYFLEAAEGHGARFYAMLQEFHIVEDAE